MALLVVVVVLLLLLLLALVLVPRWTIWQVHFKLPSSLFDHDHSCRMGAPDGPQGHRVRAHEVSRASFAFAS